MIDIDLAIAQTKKWIEDVVIGCNFCPFAAREVRQNKVRFVVELSNNIDEGLRAFGNECSYLDQHNQVETCLLILPNAVPRFDDYLELLDRAEVYLKKSHYEGIYQVASFHPLYRFAGTSDHDAANYTNRSIYPMLHLLREESIESALKKYPQPESIPERNIAFARQKGLAYMQSLRDACIKDLSG